MIREVGDRGVKLLAGLTACGLLAACGMAGTPGFEAQRDNEISISEKIGNLISFNKLAPTSEPLPQTEGPVECPTIEVQDGTASVRVGNGDNASVRYQYSLGDIARECSKAGDKLILKVGAEGRVLLGPAGAPGTFNVPIRIAVRNDATQKVVSSDLFHVAVSLPAGETQVPFSYVSQTFSVPLVPHPDEDYVILVGFDSSGKGVAAAPRSRKKRQ